MVGRDIFRPISSRVIKGVHGGIHRSPFDTDNTAKNVGPDDDGILSRTGIGVLGDGFEVGFIFLKSEGDGDGVGFMDFGEVNNFLVLSAKDNILEGNDVCSSCASRLRIFARPAREEECTIAEVGDMGSESVCF